MPGQYSIDIIEAVQHFEDREKLARDLAIAVDYYESLRAVNIVLRIALVQGLLE